MLRSALLITLLVLAATAGAQGLSYNYLQGSYGEIEYDPSGAGSVDGDGFGLNGSFAVNENFHLVGEYQTADFGAGVDVNVLELKVGYNTSISEKLDVVAHVGYMDFEIDSPIGALFADDGFLIGGGLRAAVSERVEIHGGLDYIDFDLGGGETGVNGGFVVALTDTFSAALKVSVVDDFEIYQLNLRYNFE